MKVNVKGIEMYLYKGDAVPTTLVPTAISKDFPAQITVAATGGITEGSPVAFTGTGFDELDEQTFVVGNLTGTTFDALGANTTDSVGVLGTSPEANVYAASDRVKLCLSAIEISPPSVNQIDTSTYCEESSMVGRATPGALTLTGYIEKDSPGFNEIVAAEEDGLSRQFIINLSGDQGYLIGAIALSGLGYNIPLEGAVGFTISGSQTSKIRYVHD